MAIRCAFLIFAALGSAAAAVPLEIDYADPPGVGYYDQTPFGATDLGEARRTAFDLAARTWADRLAGSVPLSVQTQWASMGGSAADAPLASGGPAFIDRDFANAPTPNVWYPIALANQFIGADEEPAEPDIIVRFNLDVDGPTALGDRGFYYGLDGLPGVDVDFTQIAMREIARGLGFYSNLEVLKDSVTGAFLGITGEFLDVEANGNRYPSVFDRFLARGPTGSSLLRDETADQRKADMTSGDLYFAGPHTAGHNAGSAAHLYAPSSFVPGASVVLLDEATYSPTDGLANVNELLTPLPSAVIHEPGPIAIGVLQDLGWTVLPYTGDDAAKALRVFAGLESPSAVAVLHLDAAAYNRMPPTVDLLDALRIARQAMGTDPNP
ncbi:MAG TPA: hypothetical protein VGM37_01010 [Armatimonadota bacterium]